MGWGSTARDPFLDPKHLAVLIGSNMLMMRRGKRRFGLRPRTRRAIAFLLISGLFGGKRGSEKNNPYQSGERRKNR